MTIWTFADYISAGGTNVVEAWLCTISVKARAKIDSRLVLMENIRQWPEKWASSYKGYDGLFEFRISFDGVQYRPLFAYSITHRMQINLLAGSIEKQRIPRAILDAADERRREVERDPSRVIRHRFSAT